MYSNKTVGPGKSSKLTNIGPMSIPEARVAGPQTSNWLGTN